MIIMWILESGDKELRNILNTRGDLLLLAGKFGFIKPDCSLF